MAAVVEEKAEIQPAQLELVEAPKEEIQVNLDNLLIGDLETLDQASANNLPMKDLISFLERIVEGGVRHLPLTRLNDIVEALGQAVDQVTNPGN